VFDRRVAFADAHFAQDEEQRGSLTDRGMVFVLLGPPTYAGRKPLRTGDDTSDNAGMFTEETDSGPTAGGRRPTVHFTGGSTKAAESTNNYREIWHYRKELLPKGTGYQQVDVEFITKKGYGVNVLEREPKTLTTLEAARHRTK